MASAKRTRLKRLESKLGVGKGGVESFNAKWLERRIETIRVWSNLAGGDPEEIAKSNRKAFEKFRAKVKKCNAEGRRVVPKIKPSAADVWAHEVQAERERLIYGE